MFLDPHDSPGKKRRVARSEADAEPLLVVPDQPSTAGGVVKLGAAECEIVAAVARGLTNREIAAQLGKPESTVKKQLSKVYRKLGISRRVRLIMMFRT